MARLSLSRGGIIRLNTPFAIELHLLLLPLVLSAVCGGYLWFFVLGWVSALCHECCHILVGNKLGIAVSGIRLLPFGVCAPLKQPLIRQPGREILMALSGPGCNLILALLGRGISYFFPSPLLSYAILCNLSMACINLLPCLPLDGGRVFRCLLTLGLDTFSACRIALTVSKLVASCLLGMGIFLLLTAPFQFSLLLIGVFLLGNLCNEQKTVTAQMLRELLYEQKKPDAEALTHVTTLTAYESLPARQLLRKLSYHRYLVVKVLDHNRTVIKTLTESQILNALLTQSIRITLGEI